MSGIDTTLQRRPTQLTSIGTPIPPSEWWVSNKALVLWTPVASPIQAHAAQRPNLQAYCQRMKARYYG